MTNNIKNISPFFQTRVAKGEKNKKSWSFQTLAGSKPDLAVHYKNLAVHYKTLAGSKPALAGSNPTLAGERFGGWPE